MARRRRARALQLRRRMERPRRAARPQRRAEEPLRTLGEAERGHARCAPRTSHLGPTRHPYPVGSARLVANRHTLALALTLALTLTLGRRAQDDLPGLVAHDHTDDHHRLLIRLISRHRRSIRTQVPQAADHQDPLPAGALTLHCMHTACALHSCTCTASHGRDPPARRTGAVCPSTTRQASTS